MHLCDNAKCNIMTTNLRFCSRSCSAQQTGLEKPTRVIQKACLNCGRSVAKKPKIYCDLNCQRRHQESTLLSKWLDTGKGHISSSSTHYIRKYIRDEQNNLCALCTMPNIWRGKPIVFVLDHIDGNSDNNKRENLRLVCPNCDSQLDTYKAKNKGSGRHYRRERYANGQSY